MPRLLAILVALTCTAASACWFSSTRPETTVPSSGGDPAVGPDEVVVSGIVQLFDRTDHHLRAAPEWPVKLTLYVRDRDGGAPVLADRKIVLAGRDGVYTVRFIASTAVAIDVQGRLCGAEQMDCCLDDPPCSPSQCDIWEGARRVQVEAGKRIRSDVSIGCLHVP